MTSISKAEALAKMAKISKKFQLPIDGIPAGSNKLPEATKSALIPTAQEIKDQQVAKVPNISDVPKVNTGSIPRPARSEGTRQLAPVQATHDTETMWIDKSKCVIVSRDALNPGKAVQDRIRKQESTPVAEWTDDSLKNRYTFSLKKLGDKEIIVDGMRMMKALCEGVSEADAAIIINLAWNLKDTDMVSYVYQTPDSTNPCFSAEKKNLRDVNERVLATGVTPVYTPPNGFEENEYAAAFCFVAASTLRMFSKTADNYLRAIPMHIPQRYYKFYQSKWPLEGFKPDIACLQGLAMIYTTKGIFKNALAPFLYLFHELADNQGMCRMLFEQHLAMTGLHAYSLYLRVLGKFNCDAWDLSSSLWHNTTKNALMEITNVLAHYEFTQDAKQERNTWRYARLFENQFPALQTKSCTNLVCALAFICKHLGIGGKQDVMQIAHIRDMTPAAQRLPIAWGLRICYLFHESANASGGNPVTTEPDQPPEK
jgi:hypothetical protein